MVRFRVLSTAMFVSYYLTVLHAVVPQFVHSPFSLSVLCFIYFVRFHFLFFYILHAFHCGQKTTVYLYCKGLEWVSLPPLGKVTCLGLPQP